MAYDKISPLGRKFDDYQHAATRMQACGSKTAKLEDFLLFHKPIKPKQTADQMWAALPGTKG